MTMRKEARDGRKPGPLDREDPARRTAAQGAGLPDLQCRYPRLCRLHPVGALVYHRFHHMLGVDLAE